MSVSSLSSSSTTSTDEQQQYQHQQQTMYFDDCFDLSIFLYKGQFGDSYRCIEKDTGDKYTVKILKPLPHSKSTYASSEVRFSREGAIWRRLKHRNIVELVRIFKTSTEQFLVTEYIKDGKLFDQIEHYTTYTERDVCHFAKQLLEALSYLRRKRIIHRDITTDNLLIKQSSRGEIVKICDFGMCLRLEKGQKYTSTEPNGAPLHLAPETVLERPIGYAVDAWSVGIILFTLLAGYPPFWNERPEVLYGQILTHEIVMTSFYWENVSEFAKDLISALLDKNPVSRLTPEQAINHGWINKNENIPKFHRQKTVEKIKEFNCRRKSRGTLFTVQNVFHSRDNNNKQNDDSIISSYGGLRRAKERGSSHTIPGKMTVLSKTKYDINNNNNTNVSHVYVAFAPRKVSVDLTNSPVDFL